MPEAVERRESRGAKRSFDEALGDDQVSRQEANKVLVKLKAWSQEDDMDEEEYQLRLQKPFKKLHKDHPELASKVFAAVLGKCWDPQANKLRDDCGLDVGALLAIHAAEELESLPTVPPAATPPVPRPPSGRVAVPVGIINKPGNNMCYLIAIVQLFYNIPAVRRAILKVRTGLEGWPEDALSEAGFARNVSNPRLFVHFLQVVFHDLGSQHGPVCAEELAQQLEKLDSQAAHDSSSECFELGRQHDAHEFAAKMCEVVQELDDSGGLKRYLEGSWRQVVYAPGSESGKDVPFSSPAEPAVTLDGSACLSEAIEKLLGPVSLAGDNQYKDEQGNLHDATKRTSFNKIPPVVCFALQRQTGDDGRKISTKFAYDKNIELTEVGEEGGMELTKTYELFAVVMHRGASIKSGHYWLYVRQNDPSKTEEWFKIDCDAVCECNEREVYGAFGDGLSRDNVCSAYMLCYVDRDACAALFEQTSDSEARHLDTLMAKRNEAFQRLTRIRFFQYDKDNSMAERQVMLSQSHAADPEDLFSRVIIDTTFTNFGLHQVKVLKGLYEKLAYDSNKLEYFGGRPGSARFAMRKLDFLSLNDNVENIVWGDCQSGKSAEAAFAAWCSVFVLGCLPIVTVRNQGGKVQGAADMRKAMSQMNERVQKILEQHFPDEDPEQYTFQIIDNIDKLRERLGMQSKAPRKLEPMVYITLNNPSQLKKLFFNTLPQRKWFPAQVIQKNDICCTVRYTGSKETEELPLSRLKKRNKPIEVGALVDAEMSETLKTQQGIFDMLAQKGTKDGKVRVIFILDEADLTVGGPKRDKNAGERLHHHQMPTRDSEIFKKVGAKRGIREYAYSSICITATPAAHLLCEWQVEKCGLCQQDLAAGEKGGQLLCNSNHLFHENCLLKFVHHESMREGFECPTCEQESLRKERQREAPEDDEDDEEEEPLPSEALLTSDDWKPVILPQFLRSLKPHIVRTDRPNNYIPYEEFMVPGDECVCIERMETPERIRKIRTKLEIYRDIWTGAYDTPYKGGSVDDWNEMMRAVRDGQQQVLWGEMKLLLKTDRTGSRVQVWSPRREKLANEDVEVFEFCQSIQNSYSGLSTAPSEVDESGITQMITHMTEDVQAGGPFRHALIISENTKNIQQQIILQKWITQSFSYIPLAVARYECRQGITVFFTQAALNKHAGLIEKALEKARNVYFQEKMKEEEELQDSTQPRRRTLNVENQIKAIEVDSEGQLFLGLQINESNVNLFYETIKIIGMKQSVVIAGNIGGRGVSFHDIGHEVILTDMYSGMYVDPGKPLPGHGEDLLQRLGRLNTIVTKITLTLVAQGLIRPRLWASPSFHAAHRHHIDWLCEYVQKVQVCKNGHEALKSMHLPVTGCRDSGGKMFPTQATRTPFASMQRRVPQGGEQLVPLPSRTSRILDLNSQLSSEEGPSAPMCSHLTGSRVDATAIIVSEHDLHLRNELLNLLSPTERIVVPNIIDRMRESESLKEDDPTKWMCWKEVWKLLDSHNGLTNFVSEADCLGAFKRLCELGRAQGVKFVVHVDLDNVFLVSQRPQPNTVELLHSAMDRDRGNDTYEKVGLISTKDMPAGVFCHCECVGDAARALRKEDLHQCTFCLWHIHTCKGQVAASSAGQEFVCSACRSAQEQPRQ